jgi:hypothetical protein
MKKPRLDLPALIFGLIFMAISGWWLAARGYGYGLPSVGFIVAGLLILVGVAGIATALRNNRE